MAKESINIGTVANDGTGDRIRVGFTKTNNNFTELYNTNSTQNNSISAAFLQANAGFALANSSSIYANGAFTAANSASVLAQAAFNYANTIVSDTQVDPYSRNHSNASFDIANSAAAYSNTVSDSQNTSIQFARNHANSSFGHANASFDVANSAAAYSNTVDATQNTNISYIWNYANAAFDYANTISGGASIDNVARTAAATADNKGTSAGFYANGAFASANNEAGVNATQNTNITIAQNTADAGFVHANASFNAANNEAGVNATQNTNITNAQNTGDAAFLKANNEAGVNATQNTNITNAQNTGDAAFIRANNSLNANTGGAISGNLLPTTTNTYYLGSDSNRWHSLYVGPGSIDLGGLVLSNQNGTLAVSVGGQPPTQISGSDQVARDTANGAFASANTKVSKSGDTMTGDLKFGGGGGILNLPTNQIAITANVDTDVSGFIALATGVSTVYANTEVIIQANTGGATFSQWNFNKDGTITFPDSTVQTTAYVPGDEIDPYARNHANAAFASANNVAPQIEPAFTTANGAFAKANNEAGVNATQNTNITNAQNTGDAAFLKANNEAGVNATQNTNITNAQNTGDAAFIHANASFNAANNVFPQIQPSFNTANAAFIRANNSLNANNGGTITGDVSITGNLSVLGNTFTISATTIVANDTVILLGAGNYTSDLLDIGISAHYNDGVNAHTGLIRDHGTKEWQLFEGYTGEIGANNDVIITDPSFKKATLNANLKTQLITLNNQNLQTYIDGAYNTANASFASANNIDGINTTQNNSITAAFAAANNEAGVNATQNTNITNAQNTADAAFLAANNASGADQVARNTANAAFLTANTANNTANIAYRTNFISATKQRLVVFQEGGISFRYRFPDIAGPTANSPTLNVIAGQTYAFDVSAIEGSGFGGFKLYTASPFASGSALSGVTHVSSSGVVTSNATSGYTNGILYWTAPTSLVGNTTLGYGDTTYNSIFGSIRVQSPADGGLAFSAANTASNTAIYRSLTPAATKFRITEGASGANWQIDQYSGNYPTIYVISGQTYVFDFNFNQDRSGSSSYFRLLDDSNTEFTGNVAYVSTANTSSITGASYSSTPKFAGSVYWKVPTSAEGKIYKYENGASANFSNGNIVIISHSALANAANSVGAFAVANAAFIHANNAFIAANSAGIYANGAFAAANAALFASDSFARNHANAAFIHANSSFIHANSSFIHANAAFTAANSANAVATSAGVYANGAFANSNTVSVIATSAGVYANGAFAAANAATTTNITQNNSITAAFTAANSANVNATSAGVYANGAFAAANAAAAAASSGSGGPERQLWGIGSDGFSNGILLGRPGQNISSPVQLTTATNWKKLATGAGYTQIKTGSAIKTDGTLWSWGTGTGGQRGDNATNYISSPVQVLGGGSWRTVSKGLDFTVALKMDGTLWGWGTQSSGELGLDGAFNAAFSSPVQIGTSNTWTDVIASVDSVMALKGTGTLWTWGKNAVAQLGLNDTANRSSPTQVGTYAGWKKLFSDRIGNGGKAALKDDGTLWLWGGNAYGKLGLNEGVVVRRSSPTQLGTETNWKSVTLLNQNLLFVKTDGTLWATGSQLYGITGNSEGGGVSRSSPNQIGANTNWHMTFDAHGAAGAMKTNGTMWAWGGNVGIHGYTVDNSNAYRSSPVQVGYISPYDKWVDIKPGGSLVLFIKKANVDPENGNDLPEY